MIPELGNFALILALFVAIVQGSLPIFGTYRNHEPWVNLASQTAKIHALLVGISFACLCFSALNNDFSVRYVAQNSNTLLPAAYRFASVWGGHEGSLLLWVLILALWTLAVAMLSRSLPRYITAQALAVLGLISAGFLAFMVFTSNPFERLPIPPAEGRDLNPLLQDPGLIIHPPMLYMGYVGFSVAYAFAIAALLSGQLNSEWARWIRPWTLAAWIFLTIGIGLGSWWAYYELGWGGWWFWDPVENASFMPWLVGTALLHSLAVSEKRNSFKSWTILLAISAFSLSLLGTFLVRSGVLTSVHAFATDPERGIFILAFLMVSIGASLALYAWRAPSIGIGGRFALFSRESALLTNNLLLVVAASCVLLGTLYPLFIDALGLGKLSVGPPYFNAVFIPLMLPLAILIGIGPFMRWKEDHSKRVFKQLRWIALGSLLLGLLLSFAFGPWSALAALSLIIACWIILSSHSNFFMRVASTHPAPTIKSWVLSCKKQPLNFIGMHCAHIGVAIFIIGVTLVSTYEEEKDVRIGAGDTVHIGHYTLKFNGISTSNGPNYRAVLADIDILDDAGTPYKKMLPEKRFYFSSTMPMTEAAIDLGLLRDIYVSLGEPIDKEQVKADWAIRIYYKPFVSWIWGGCAFMALGGFLALLDRRYRSAASKNTAKGEI